MEDNGNIEDSIYGTNPGLVLPIIAIVVFSILMVPHCILTIRSRMWWTVVFCIGGGLQIAGYAARAASHDNAWDKSLYIFQSVALVISPIFFSAGLYCMLSVMVSRFGRAYSLLSARAVTWIFVACDIISLMVQGAGGGMASGDGSSAENGPHVLVGGIAFQLVALSLFSILTADFVRRVLSAKAKAGWIPPIADDEGPTAGRPGLASLVEPSSGADRAAPSALPPPPDFSRPWKVFTVAIALGTAMIFIRSIYRLVEFLLGWHSEPSLNDFYLAFLDALPMACFLGIFVLFHPSIVLKQDRLRQSGQVVVPDLDGQAPLPSAKSLGARGEDSVNSAV